jgi:TorA maturation chaperone TorD
MHADKFVIPAEAASVTKLEADVEVLRAQAGLYAFLGRCLESEVDQALLVALRGPLRDTLEELGIDIGEDLRSGAPKEVLADLGEEFAALFVVPGAVLPYRSAYETGRLFQPQADLATAAYRDAGFDFRNILSGEFPDHVAVMLAFVGRLLERQAEALEAGNTDAAAEWQRRREHFLLHQIGGWAVGWSRRAQSCARHPFYLAVLGLSEQVIWADIGDIADEKTLKRLVKSNRRPLVKQKTDHAFRKASGF